MFSKLSSNLVTTKFDSKVKGFNTNLNDVFKKHENLSIIYDNMLNNLVVKSLLSRFDILTITNNSINNYLTNDIGNFSNKSDTIISFDDNNLFNNSNDILLYYVDGVNSLKTQLNVFDLYSSSTCYNSIMYDFTVLNNNIINNHEFVLNRVSKIQFNSVI